MCQLPSTNAAENHINYNFKMYNFTAFLNLEHDRTVIISLGSQFSWRFLFGFVNKVDKL